MRAPRSPQAILLLASLSFAAMAFAAKVASRALPGEQVAFLRFVLMLAPFAVSPALARQAATFRRVDLLVYRGLFGGAAVLLYFLAIAHIPVGLAMLFNSTSPVWAVLFAALFLGERTRARLLGPLILVLAGVALAGGALVEPIGPLRLGPWEWVALASAVLSGAAVASVRAARRSEGSWSIYGSFTLCGVLVTAPFALPGFVRPDAAGWALLAVVGATSIAAQLLMTYAYRWVNNLQAGAILQSGVVVTLALGVLLLGERLAPSQWAGAALVVGGVLGVVWLQAPPRAVE